MRNPLKLKPLHNPGDSLERQIRDVVFDRMLLYLMLTAYFVAIAVMEWIRWYFNSPPFPKTYTVLALAAAAFATVKIRRDLAYVKRLRLGQQGEIAVGQFLETLRTKGAQVLHDVPGDGFNIDHVVIHESGIYAIETKTISKPDRGETKVIFDGKSIEICGRKPDRNPVVQARAGAKWLRDLVHRSTGKQFPVRPVVIFPDWYVERTAEAKGGDVWVLNQNGLPSFIARERPQITDADVQMITMHLSMYVRGVAADAAR